MATSHHTCHLDRGRQPEWRLALSEVEGGLVFSSRNPEMCCPNIVYNCVFPL